MSTNRIRNKGSYAPLSAHYYKDDAIDEAGPDAELLYVRGLAFCAEMLSDGFISDRQLVRFVGVGLDHVQDRAKALVSVQLWERDDHHGGYWVRSWLDWNRSREEITDYKAKDAERKRKTVQSDDDHPPNPPPKGGQKTSGGTPSGLRTESESSSEGIPSGIQPRARTPRHSTTDTKQTLPLAALADRSPPRDPLERFGEFWAAYPRRIDRRTAEKAWRAALKRGDDPEHIIDAARAYAQITLTAEKKFIKYPATWLNAAAYDNEPEQSAELKLVSGGDNPWFDQVVLR